ncbi:DUF7344 domain-containing protein [Halopiger thermotolerans]
MSSDAHLGDTSGRAPLDEVPPEQYEAFSHPRRVYLLEILTGGDGPVDDAGEDDRYSLFELTSELVRREAPDAPTGQARHEIRLSLLHNHLPRLADCGIVEWDPDAGVELVAEPELCPAAIASLLEETDAAGADGESDIPADDELLQRVVDPVRLQLVRIVHENDGSLSIERLAAELAARESPGPSETETAKIELHHAHLPALDAVGVLEYDPDTGLVTATPTTDAVSLIP